MSRRIRARTLAHLLSQYIRRHPEEAAGHAKECDADEGMELLALLPPNSAWALADHLDLERFTSWIQDTDETLLRRLLEDVGTQRLTRLWQAADETLQRRLLESAPSATQARLKALAKPGRESRTV